MAEDSVATLVKDGEVYGPEQRGKKDILIVAGRIVKVADEIAEPPEFSTRVVDAGGKYVTPGFIDPHVHLLGGGGEDGPRSRVPELDLGELVEAGTTTVVGVLGTDGISRSLEALLMKVKAFREKISGYMYTSSYRFPPMTLTGKVSSDIALFEEVIGVKVAISDHRSSFPTADELAKLASEARVGGMLGGAPGLVHAHVGDGPAGIQPLFDLAENTELPISGFLPTHVNRSPDLLERGAEFTKRGGYIDLTVPGSESGDRHFGDAVKNFLDWGGDPARVTFSSDGNGSLPTFDESGELTGITRGRVGRLSESTLRLARDGEMSLDWAVSFITKNPAAVLGIDGNKGQIEEGKDGDLVVLDEGLTIEQVISGGRLVVENGSSTVGSRFT